MDTVIENAIEESWKDYQDATIGMDENEKWAHEHGWKEGAEWILTELEINKEISEKTLKKYMDKIK